MTRKTIDVQPWQFQPGDTVVKHVRSGVWQVEREELPADPWTVIETTTDAGRTHRLVLADDELWYWVAATSSAGPYPTDELEYATFRVLARPATPDAEVSDGTA